jgi:hypothetical protein
MKLTTPIVTRMDRRIAGRSPDREYVFAVVEDVDGTEYSLSFEANVTEAAILRHFEKYPTDFRVI